MSASAKRRSPTSQRRVGSYEVVFRHPQLGERRENVLVTLRQPVRLGVDMRRETAMNQASVRRQWRSACVTFMGSASYWPTVRRPAAGQSTLCVSGVRRRVVDGGRLQTDRPRSSKFEQYRVFCLVALGRTAEAEKVIASVVVENPTFVPDARRDLAAHSGNVSRAYAGGWCRRSRSGCTWTPGRRWNRKDTAAASSQFAALVQLIDSAALRSATANPVARTRSRCWRSCDCWRRDFWT